MTHACFQPAVDLTPFIRTYFVLQGDMPKGLAPQRITPKGEAALFFVFGQPACVRVEELPEVRCKVGSVIEHPLLVGQSDHYAFWNWEGPLNLLVVALQSNGLYYFCRENISSLRNTIIDFEHANQLPAFRELQDRLWMVQTPKEAVELVETYLRRQFQRAIARPLPCDIHRVAAEIRRQHGMVRIDAVAKQFRCPPRNMELLFTAQIGLSPKQYAGIIRFREMVRQLYAKPRVDWMDLAYEFKYYDQSHLIRDFRRYTGATPRKFEREEPLFDTLAYKYAF